MQNLITNQIYCAESELYPSEYAYHKYSVSTRTERASANCRNYLYDQDINTRSEDYIHCNGTQLRLTDSDFGPEQYRSSYYYVWSAGSGIRQLLFIFPTRVNLTTITLHYYSDSQRGLPRLRFYAAPDDFDIWDAPPGNSRYADIAAVPQDEESAGRRNVSVNVDFTTTKVLMVKASSSFELAVSEVQFSVCNGKINVYGIIAANLAFHCCQHTDTCTARNIITTTDSPLSPTQHKAQTHHVTTTINGKVRTTSPDSIPATTAGNDMTESTGESIASWIVPTVVTLSLLLLLTLIVTAIIVLLRVYKKQRSKGNGRVNEEVELESNPCYEATKVNQTVTTEVQGDHVYEVV